MTPIAEPPDDPTLPARYDEHAEAAPGEAELAWYDAWLPRDRGSVLEVGCGVGRLTVPLALRGHALHGADPSAARLDRCLARLAAAGAAAQLHPQAPERLNLPMRYAAAFAGSCAFQRVAAPHAATGALERIRAHLIEPGLLAIDVFVPGFAAARPGAALFELASVALDDGSTIRRRSETEVDAEAPRVSCAHRYTRRRGSLALGEWRERVEWTWYEPGELADLVAGAGWRDVHVVDAPWPAPRDGTHYAIVARA